MIKFYILECGKQSFWSKIEQVYGIYYESTMFSPTEELEAHSIALIVQWFPAFDADSRIGFDPVRAYLRLRYTPSTSGTAPLFTATQSFLREEAGSMDRITRALTAFPPLSLGQLLPLFPYRGDPYKRNVQQRVYKYNRENEGSLAPVDVRVWDAERFWALEHNINLYHQMKENNVTDGETILEPWRNYVKRIRHIADEVARSSGITSAERHFALAQLCFPPLPPRSVHLDTLDDIPPLC